MYGGFSRIREGWRDRGKGGVSREDNLSGRETERALGDRDYGKVMAEIKWLIFRILYVICSLKICKV